jgi:RNA polymerase sigma-70 factor (ECF subfamily)
LATPRARDDQRKQGSPGQTQAAKAFDTPAQVGAGETDAGGGAPLPRDPNEALRLHGSWLRAVAIARLRGLEGADDVMQDVAVAAVRNWDTLRTTANAKPWLYRLTVRAALMHRRTLGRARRRISEAIETYRSRHGATEGDVAATDPLRGLLSSERHLELRAAVARLPVKDVEMLLMKHVDDCSYQEIAARMGVTAGVVQMRLFRARQKLREMLAKKED